MTANSILNSQKSADPPLDSATPDGELDNSLVDRLFGNRQHCVILNGNQDKTHDDRTLALAWSVLEDEMALVPTRDLTAESSEGQAIVESIYIDRFTVTNADFARFLADGGYSQTELWPQQIWPNVLQFVDLTGNVGPRFWRDGKPPRKQDNHPVVGVCWYEANAYALWVGKRLPKSAEWQHSVSWCTGSDGRDANVRYPWGNSFDPTRCNTWLGGPGDTVPVDSHYEGCTPNGIYQLVGNVGEWVATQFGCGTSQQGIEVQFEQPMAEIRGGAFDTYFENQATCRFRTGQPFLFRGRNTGFRCCVSTGDLTSPPDPSAFV